jgi:hypothetical protein
MALTSRRQLAEFGNKVATRVLRLISLVQALHTIGGSHAHPVLWR